jgi:hypothetical protein
MSRSGYSHGGPLYSYGSRPWNLLWKPCVNDASDLDAFSIDKDGGQVWNLAFDGKVYKFTIEFTALTVTRIYHDNGASPHNFHDNLSCRAALAPPRVLDQM